MNTRDGFILFVLLNVLDAATTWVGMSQGGEEWSPVLRFLAQGEPLRLVLFKTLAVVLVMVAAAAFKRFRWPWALLRVNIVLGVVCLTNLAPIILHEITK